MRLTVTSLLLILFSFAQAQEIAIIPQPVQINQRAGTFLLPNNISVEMPSGSEFQPVWKALQAKLKITGARLTQVHAPAQALIRMIKDSSLAKRWGPEGYQLNVMPRMVEIRSATPAGFFYALQTFWQLLPKEIESVKEVKNVKWSAPCVEITDYPRFAWRGLMFDVTRHFFGKEDVKRFIDNMVRYKYNLLHLHLTDDEGWRIEIKSLPNLTKVGAWNVKKTGYFGTFSPPTADEPRDNGGFYTQEDLKELIQYAKERFVNIMPEIDVPGHSLAAIASYPELSCTPEAKNYVVRSGEQIMDWSRGAPPIALVDNTLCPANDKVYEFLDKVLTEVAAIFPFEYIHMGGDEAPHNFWEKNPMIRDLMQRENLTTMQQVQAYFTRKVEQIVRAKGKKFMGWDEILEGGGLPPSVAVMSWRSMKAGAEAAKTGHEVVMSPTEFAYLDYMQGDVALEPRVYATLRLSKAYQFDPVPVGVDAKWIKGGQANLWSEQVYNNRHLEYMVWPRAFAIAESVWSPAKSKDWKQFFARVEQHFQRFNQAQIKYAPSVYDPIIKVARAADDKMQIDLSTEVEGLTIYYTFDNSFPDQYYPAYKSPIVPPKDAVMLRMITYRGDQPIGRLFTIPLADLEKRLPKKK